jgi:2-hydroxychromene-2-carboxylate isomerase
MSKPVKVRFKHEATVNGHPVGPMDVITQEDLGKTGGRPYIDPTDVQWYTLAEAKRRATELGVPLEQT